MQAALTFLEQEHLSQPASISDVPLMETGFGRGALSPETSLCGAELQVLLAHTLLYSALRALLIQPRWQSPAKTSVGGRTDIRDVVVDDVLSSHILRAAC